MSNIKFTLKIKEVAKKTNLPESVVEDIFNSQFKFFKEEVQKLPLRELKSKEEFEKLKTSFYFKFIGKIHSSWYKLGGKAEKIQESINRKLNKNKNNNNE